MEAPQHCEALVRQRLCLRITCMLIVEVRQSACDPGQFRMIAREPLPVHCTRFHKQRLRPGEISATLMALCNVAYSHRRQELIVGGIQAALHCESFIQKLVCLCNAPTLAVKSCQ